MHKTGFPVHLQRVQWHFPGWSAQTCCTRGWWAGGAHLPACPGSVHLSGRKVSGGQMLPEVAGFGCPVSCQPPETPLHQGGWLGLTFLSLPWPLLRKTEQVFPLFRLLWTWSASRSEGGEPSRSGGDHGGAATVSAGSFATANQPSLCSSKGEQLCKELCSFRKSIYLSIYPFNVTSNGNSVKLRYPSLSFSSVGLESKSQSPGVRGMAVGADGSCCLKENRCFQGNC